jgi:N-dimethylarginine dimethylaminohydrolase
LVRAPEAAYAQVDPELWGYQGRPDLDAARREHAALVAALERSGVQVHYHGAALPGQADAHFVCDPFAMTPHGAVVARMGKALRRAEPDAMDRRLEELGIPILARLRGELCLEGGDVVWLDSETVAVGIGFRTDRAGLAELRRAVYQEAIQFIPVVLPWNQGPLRVMHLGTAFSLVDQRTALLHRPLLPVEFVEWLQARAYRLVDVEPSEWPRQGVNALALEPGLVILAAHNPRTQARLEEADVRGIAVELEELGVKGEGGPTCLVAPLWRGE